MGITQDIKKLQEQMKVMMDLLRHPDKQAGTVLYLVETIQNLENINFDLSTKWNTAVNYLQNKQLVQEYNNWCIELNKLSSPELKRLFMMQPIDGPKETPVAPDLCSTESPFKEGMTCLDLKGHEGGEHIGVDDNGKMWRWTEDKDLGMEETVPEAPAETQPDAQEGRPEDQPEDFPEAPEEPEEPDKTQRDFGDDFPEH